MNRDSGTRATAGGGPECGRRWTALATLLAGGLLLAPAASAALPARLPLAQEETDAQRAGGSQVIAQGISRLPKGEIAWTVRRLDVPSDAGTATAAFPLGFAIADGATIAVLDDAGDVLSILDDGEAAFLPSGKGGALASFRDETAGVFEVALIGTEDAASGESSGSIVGDPFTAPEGRSFEIELARETLDGEEQATVPLSRSGAPTLFLVTEGTVQLAPPGGEPVELAAGQYALLLGEVVAQRAGDAPAAFVAAAIGDAVANRGGAADGTPEARAGREDRQAARANRAGGGGREARADRQSTGGGRGGQGGGRGGQGGGGRGGRGGQGGQGGQTQQPQVPGAPGETPGTGGTPAPQDPGTASPTAPADGAVTPAPTAPVGEATPPADENEVLQEAIEATVAAAVTAAAPTMPPEETLPIEEAPPAEDQTGVESESIAPTTPPEAEQPPPVEEAPPPVEEAPPPPEGEQPADPATGG